MAAAAMGNDGSALGIGMTAKQMQLVMRQQWRKTIAVNTEAVQLEFVILDLCFFG
jgi:hypothetical protein